LDFVVDVDSRGDYSVVRVCGEVDLYTSPMLDSCLSNLINSEKSLIAVDLSDCSYFDSDGIKTLVKWSRRLGEDGESGAVSRAFKICGLDSVIPILPSVEAAVQL